jgi:anti-sigma regulatory factor (Ser/Thr protein kinase)
VIAISEKEWTRRDFLELAALSTAVGSARGHVGHVLREWDLGVLREVAELVTSELLANALRATWAVDWPVVSPHTPSVRLWLRADDQRLVIFVWDACPGLPARRAAGPDAESGRGLAIVDALCADWNACHPPGPGGGKVVWALITTP